MFDTRCSNSIHINAVSGTIVKNYDDSFFVRFHLKSPYADGVLNSTPKHCGKPAVVLQMMVCGDMEVIAEIIYKEDLKKAFEKEQES